MTELRHQAQLDQPEVTAAAERDEREHRLQGFPLNRDQTTGRFFRNGRSGEGRKQLRPNQFDQLQSRFAVPLQRHGYPLI